MIRVSWPQALAWRLRRHELDPVGRLSAPEIVRRLSGVQALVASSAELAIRVRTGAVAAGGVAEALAGGDLIKTWAMRGTLHLLTPEEAGTFLSLLAASRPWVRPAWQRYFQMDPDTMDRFRDVVIDALDGRTLTREELIEVITAAPGLDHLGEGLRSGWGTLFKPVAWQGGLCFGPPIGNRATFRRPDQASARWAGLPDPEMAGPEALHAYIAAYGPATPGSFRNWLSRGMLTPKRVAGWIADLGHRVTEVDLEGVTAYVPAEHLDELAATKPSSTVRLLGGFDQWVLGPGTDDGYVIAPARRRDVSRSAGWIAPVVVRGGVVTGTWEADGGTLRVAWFAEAGKPPKTRLEPEARRLSRILARDLRLEVATT